MERENLFSTSMNFYKIYVIRKDSYKTRIPAPKHTCISKITEILLTCSETSHTFVN